MDFFDEEKHDFGQSLKLAMAIFREEQLGRCLLFSVSNLHWGTEWDTWNFYKYRANFSFLVQKEVPF